MDSFDDYEEMLFGEYLGRPDRTLQHHVRGMRPTSRNNDPRDFAFKCIGDDKDEKLPSCHYTDERFKHPQTIFGRRKKRGGYDYSDRYPQWDYEKWDAAHKHASGLDVVRDSVRYYEAVLSYFHGKETVIDHVLTGFNVSSGYSFYVFGYYHPRKKK